MIKNQLATKEKTAMSTTDKQAQRSNFINEFIISNMFNVFKVTYIKDCHTKKSWKEKIEMQVGGHIEARGYQYDVEVMVYAYSEKEEQYISQKHMLYNLAGFEIVDECFDKIKQISSCDMLVIRIMTTEEEFVKYNCCYLFARN